jgi:hypothetical protein
VNSHASVACVSVAQVQRMEHVIVLVPVLNSLIPSLLAATHRFGYCLCWPSSCWLLCACTCGCLVDLFFGHHLLTSALPNLESAAIFADYPLVGPKPLLGTMRMEMHPEPFEVTCRCRHRGDRNVQVYRKTSNIQLENMVREAFGLGLDTQVELTFGPYPMRHYAPIEKWGIIEPCIVEVNVSIGSS